MAGVSFYNLPAVNPYLLSNYPGAAAAYSLRKLRGSYSGSAIRVRRASDNTEQDIGFVGEDLDTAALTTFCTGTDGFVATWYDQSGNGINRLQITAASQPKIYDSITGVLLINGNPYISFANGNILSGTGVNREWMFLACYNLNLSTGSYIAGTTTSNSVRLGINFSSNNDLWYRSASASLKTFNWGTTPNVVLSLDFINLLLWTNTIAQFAQISGTPTTPTASTAIISVGTFDVSELIMYTSNQSANRTGIETNINDYYNIYP